MSNKLKFEFSINFADFSIYSPPNIWGIYARFLGVGGMGAALYNADAAWQSSVEESTDCF